MEREPANQASVNAEAAADEADAADVEADAADDAAAAAAVNAAVGRPVPRLGSRERAVLDFEVKRWKHAGAKEEAIRDAFGFSATRYYQILNALLDDPAALAYRPTLVVRLRRVRDAHRDARG